MKKILLAIFSFSAVTTGFAQQLQTSSFYDQQGVFHNPSTAGVQKHGMVGVTYRKQWTGIAGSPTTATLFGSTFLQKQNFGIGGYIYNDKTGPTSRTGLNLAFAKHIPMKKGTFSVGIETKFHQYAIDIEKLSQSIANDPVLGNGDSKFKFDAGFGISYTSDNFQIGASVAQLVQSKLDFYSGDLSRTGEAKLYRHYYFHGLYKFQVDETTSITPNFLFTYLPNAPKELQAGARVEHSNLLQWGVAFRANQGWLVNAGVKIQNKTTIGYSFEIYKTPLSVYDAGSNAHELMLKYEFLK